MNPDGKAILPLLRSVKKQFPIISAAFGNAATRIEAFIATGGAYVYSSYGDIDGLFREKGTELDRKRRETVVHRIQQLTHDKAMVAPIVQVGLMSGCGPRVQESVSGWSPATCSRPRTRTCGSRASRLRNAEEP